MPVPAGGDWQAAFEELRGKQRSTEEKVNLQQERIDELSQQLLTLRRAADQQQVPANASSSVSVPVSGAADEDENGLKSAKSAEGHVETALYQFQESMWDASLLLFLGRPKLVDSLVLLAGTAMNVGLQFLLLWVVYKNMLENPYDDAKVEGMVDWRITTAQADFPPSAGATTTLAWRLCTLKLWSYEQAEYEEMHNYLYKPVPGIWLSLLAIILWILVCLREYRVCLEQFLAVMNLPVVDRLQPSLRVREGVEESIQVVGIGRLQKFLALLFLCLLRLSVIAILSLVGCAWLARTVSLNDIVLNAVALAFVLDVDEGLCVVMLTQGLRSKLSKMEPLSCGSATRCAIGGISVKDLFRYILFGVLLTVTIQAWLVPFKDNVESAALALCGGDTNFTYAGGTFTQQSVLIKPLVEAKYKLGCDEDEDLTAQYVSTYYPGVQLNSSAKNATRKNETRTAVESRLQVRRRNAVLGYAFRQCGSGEVRSPPTNDESIASWTCRSAPSSLTKATQTSVGGGFQQPPSCSVLNVASASCNTTEFPVCMWPKEAEVCEPSESANGEFINPPGAFHDLACGTVDLTLRQQCEQWFYFGSTHPTKNCKAIDVCDQEIDITVESIDCFSLDGLMDVVLANDTAFHENTTLSIQAVTEAIKLVIPELGSPPQEVYVSWHEGSSQLQFRVKQWPIDLKDRQWRLDSQAIGNKTNELLGNQTGVPRVLESLMVRENRTEYKNWQTILDDKPDCNDGEVSPFWCIEQA